MSSHPDNKRPAYDDFSDSDDDDEVDASSSPVTLGFADGSLPKSQDESSSTDKIGGLPSFWPVCETTPPDVQAGRCKACGAAMPLLAQINAPLDPEQCEDGTVLDQEDRMRVLFVFACIQKCCSGKPNSVRVFRAVRRLAPKPKPQQEQPKAINPFAAGATAASGPFDLGSNLFSSEPAQQDDEDSESEEEEEGPPPASNRWSLPDQPSLPAQYVATEPEPASSSDDARDVKSFAAAAKSLSLDDASKPSGPEKSSRRGSGASGSKPSGDNWAGEKYERQSLPIGVDEVFFKFEERLLRANGDVASQIMRYHRPEGQPLAYTATGDAFNKLWKQVDEGKHVYDESGVPPCEACGGKRTFELQLMPQLVSILSESGLLKKKEDEFELSWASAWILTCTRDCGLPSDVSQPGETWKEELVLLQFEETSEAFKEARAKVAQS